jgi:hypothetical protein
MELLRQRRIATSLTLIAGALSIAGCGEAAQVSTDKSTKPKNPPEAISYKYTDDGKRIATYNDGVNGVLEGHWMQSIYSFCEGNDLLDQLGAWDTAGGSISRSPNHPACDDGRLTAEDFKIER